MNAFASQQTAAHVRLSILESIIKGQYVTIYHIVFRSYSPKKRNTSKFGRSTDFKSSSREPSRKLTISVDFLLRHFLQLRGQ